MLNMLGLDLLVKLKQLGQSCIRPLVPSDSNTTAKEFMTFLYI